MLHTLPRLLTFGLVALVAGIGSSAPASAQDGSPVEASTKRGPRVLDPTECGIGQPVERLTWRDLDGRPGRIGELGAKRAQVIALTDTACPLAQKYAPTLKRAAERCREEGIDFVLLNTIEGEKPEDMKAWMSKHEIEATYVHDPSGDLARALGAQTTTDVFVIDRDARRVYRGAVDDRFGLGYTLDAPRERYLEEALVAHLSEKAVAVPATWAPGCVLDLEVAQRSTELTWNGRIEPLVERRCATCHFDGGVGPFPLTTRDEVAKRKGMVAYMIEEHLMPPWTATDEGGPWRNDHSLSDEERDDLLSWIDADLPVGEPNGEGEARQSVVEPEWKIGEPDVVIQIPEALSVPAEGVVEYIELVVPTHFTEDRWVRSVEIRPTAPQVVHHVLVHILGSQDMRQGENRLPGFLAAYVPGNSEHALPPGFAKKLPAGARLFFQLHYTPNGAEALDQTRLGLVFAEEEPEHEVRSVGIANRKFAIPPGSESHPVSASMKLPADVGVLALMPHMHLRGRAFLFEHELPDGTIEPLLEVPRFDFNWQFSYRYEQPLVMPRGSKVMVTGWFDNSAENPANPDPTDTVHWGDQTFEEMMIGYVEYYVL